MPRTLHTLTDEEVDAMKTIIAKLTGTAGEIEPGDVQIVVNGQSYDFQKQEGRYHAIVVDRS